MGIEKEKATVVENPEAIVDAESGARNPTGAFPKKSFICRSTGLDNISTLVCVSTPFYFQFLCYQ